MKATIICSLLMVSLAAVAQKDLAKDKDQAKIETISTKSGVLLKKNYTDIGKIKTVEFQILELTDMATNVKTKGLVIEAPETGTYASGSARAFIDEDELNGLIKAIAKLIEVSATAVPDNTVEYNFTSRSGFKASLFNYKKKWQFAIQIDKYKSNSTVYWEGSDELTKFQEIITLAIKEITL